MTDIIPTPATALPRRNAPEHRRRVSGALPGRRVDAGHHGVGRQEAPNHDVDAAAWSFAGMRARYLAQARKGNGSRFDECGDAGTPGAPRR